MRAARMAFTLVLFAGIASGVWTLLSRATTPAVISPLASESEQSNVLRLFFPKRKNPEVLRKKVQTLIGNAWKNYSVYVRLYTSNFSMGINESVIFTAASVNKIPILAALYYNVQNQTIDLDKTVTLQSGDIQDYGTGVIRYDPPGTTYSIKTLARLMMQKSDNTAAYILANYVVGLQAIQSLVNQWGLIQTDMANNKTSNKDMEVLLAKIYNGKVANLAYTQEMLSFFQNTDFEDRLPAQLPKDATVYHKIGTEVGAVHDVGIVRQKNVTYYIGIFTSDVTDEQETARLMATISKTVYEYLR